MEARCGVRVGVGVQVGVGVIVGVEVAVGVEVGVPGRGVGVTVAVAAGAADDGAEVGGLAPGRSVLVGEGVFVGVGVGVDGSRFGMSKYPAGSTGEPLKRTSRWRGPPGWPVPIAAPACKAAPAVVSVVSKKPTTACQSPPQSMMVWRPRVSVVAVSSTRPAQGEITGADASPASEKSTPPCVRP